MTAGNWISWLFGRDQDRDQLSAPDAPNGVNTSRIPTPRRRKRTPEQQAEDQVRYQQEMRAKFKAISQRDRRRAIAAGLTHYIWRSAGDEAVCTACAKKNGKRFALKEKPPDGHPGEAEHCPLGWCRCYAEPVFPQRVSSGGRRDR